MTTTLLAPPARVSSSTLTALRDRVAALEAQVAGLEAQAAFHHQSRLVFDARLADIDAAAARQLQILWERISLQDSTIRELRARLTALEAREAL